jgi:hypothetical protein
MTTITVSGWSKEYVDEKIKEICKKVKILDTKYDKKQFPLIAGDTGDKADFVTATITFDGDLW